MDMDSIEVYQLDSDAVFKGSVHEDDEDNIGQWYWRVCQPGCLPDSEPWGPFDTEEGAEASAIAENELPMPITLCSSDDYEQTEDGWLGKAIAYTTKALARHDHSIEGCSWELASDMSEAYAVLTVSGPGQWGEDEDAYADAFDELVSRLNNDGYDVTED
jgi:hypothetical protein